MIEFKLFYTQLNQSIGLDLSLQRSAVVQANFWRQVTLSILFIEAMSCSGKERTFSLLPVLKRDFAAVGDSS